MSFATDMQKLATDLLTEFDERTDADKLTLIKKGEKTWLDGEYVFAPDTEIPLTGVAVPYSASLINNTTIQQGDIQLTITNAVEVTTADKVRVDGVALSVVGPDPIAYTGKALTIAYKVQLR